MLQKKATIPNNIRTQNRVLSVYYYSQLYSFFLIGKFAIGFYLGNSTVATVYGASGSVIIILIWVYYSAIILYFGAEFTKVYAKTHGEKIIPNDYAVEIKKEIFERKKK